MAFQMLMHIIIDPVQWKPLQWGMQQHAYTYMHKGIWANKYSVSLAAYRHILLNEEMENSMKSKKN